MSNSSYISFLYPYNLRGTAAPHLWMLCKQLEKISVDNLFCIGSKEYFYPKEKYQRRWEYDFSRDGWDKLDSIKHKYIIPQTIFDALEKEKITPNRVWESLIHNDYIPLEIALDQIIKDILSRTKVTAIFTLCNCKALSTIAAKYGLKVVHVELGALRAPLYINTAYFDGSGVNGNTESERRFNKFQEEYSQSTSPIVLYPRKKLFKSIQRKKTLQNLLSKDRYAIGLPLQVEDDSNIIAYSNGFNNLELIHYAKHYFDDKEILLRKHPLGHAEYNLLKNIDSSGSSRDFIYKCKKIATINSSVGLEALLMGKCVTVFGDSPYKFITDDGTLAYKSAGLNSMDLFLNFFVFGYLIPFDYLFDMDYSEWRLSGPTEMEIYQKHFDYYGNEERGA